MKGRKEAEGCVLWTSGVTVTQYKSVPITLCDLVYVDTLQAWVQILSHTCAFKNSKLYLYLSFSEGSTLMITCTRPFLDLRSTV